MRGRVPSLRPPRFISPPEDVVLRLGDTGHLTCVYDGAPQPRIQWFVNGTEITHNTPKYAIVHDRMQRTVSLRVNNITSNDSEGSYMCVLTNQAGQSRASADIRLHISRMFGYLVIVWLFVYFIKG